MCNVKVEFYVLLTVHLDAILGNDQLDALFLNVFILCLYMFRAASAHHQEGPWCPYTACVEINCMKTPASPPNVWRLRESPCRTAAGHRSGSVEGTVPTVDWRDREERPRNCQTSWERYLNIEYDTANFTPTVKVRQQYSGFF
jgi:hypothetical protein